MSGPRVFVALQQFCEQDAAPGELLRAAGLDVRLNPWGRRPRREDLLGALPECDAVIAGVEPYDAALLAALPRLRCISRCGVGTDAIDLAVARARRIAVLTTPDEVAEPVAELTLGLILALARNLPQHVRDAQAGQWTKRSGVLLREWTIGLVGFGRIGQAVARCLRPFKVRVLVTDPAARPEALPAGVTLVPWETLLAEADVVSLHLSRPAQAGPLMGAAEFGRMKPGSRLVNTARGYLVDEAALLAALERGQLGGAALDVYGEEPYTGPLLRRPEVVCTPHVATLTRASRAAMERRCAQNVVEFFAGAQEPIGCRSGS